MKFIHPLSGLNRNKTNAFLAFVLFFSLQGCIPGLYSFKGTNFDPNIETFYVGSFEVRANNAPPTISQTFEETLKLKIRRESRLEENNLNPNIEFQGGISRFDVSPQAPEAGEAIGFNRLTIAVEINYIDNLNEERNWKQTFSWFSDFDSDVNLLDIQDERIDEIFNQVVEEVFNRAFTDW